jgi:hypothetical protein
MKRGAVLLFFVATAVVRAQSRSPENAAQRGGAPSLASLLVALVPADPLELTGAVDSISSNT